MPASMAKRPSAPCCDASRSSFPPTFMNSGKISNSISTRGSMVDMQFASRPQAVAKGVFGRRSMRFMRPRPRARGTFLLGLMGLAALPAQAQLRVDISGGLSAPMPIAIPVMPTPQPVSTPAGTTAALGQQVSQVISNDLKGSGLFRPLTGLSPIGFAQVAAPDFPIWQQRAAQALVQGFVPADPDGKVTVACYLYDVFLKQELARQAFVRSVDRRGGKECCGTGRWVGAAK